MTRYHPLKKGYTITSGFGYRTFDNAVHTGIDFGSATGSPAGWPVFAIQGGTILYAGSARGYGGPDPAGWLVIDSPDADGSGVFEYGHIVRDPRMKEGVRVEAGQQIGTINPNKLTNGGVDPHLHISHMPYEYNPRKKDNWIGLLSGAKFPGEAVTEEPTVPPSEGNTEVSAASEVQVQLRGPGNNGWSQLAPQPDNNGGRWLPGMDKQATSGTVVNALGRILFELTLFLPSKDRGYSEYKSRTSDSMVGNAANAAAIAAENHEMLAEILGILKSNK